MPFNILFSFFPRIIKNPFINETFWGDLHPVPPPRTHLSLSDHFFAKMQKKTILQIFLFKVSKGGLAVLRTNTQTDKQSNYIDVLYSVLVCLNFYKSTLQRFNLPQWWKIYYKVIIPNLNIKICTALSVLRTAVSKYLWIYCIVHCCCTLPTLCAISSCTKSLHSNSFQL